MVSATKLGSWARKCTFLVSRCTGRQSVGSRAYWEALAALGSITYRFALPLRRAGRSAYSLTGQQDSVGRARYGAGYCPAGWAEWL